MQDFQSPWGHCYCERFLIRYKQSSKSHYIIEHSKLIQTGDRCSTLYYLHCTLYFCSYNVVENEAHLLLECPLYNFIRDKVQSPFESVILGSLESFFQLDHQVELGFVS